MAAQATSPALRESMSTSAGSLGKNPQDSLSSAVVSSAAIVIFPAPARLLVKVPQLPPISSQLPLLPSSHSPSPQTPSRFLSLPPSHPVPSFPSLHSLNLSPSLSPSRSSSPSHPLLPMPALPLPPAVSLSLAPLLPAVSFPSSLTYSLLPSPLSRTLPLSLPLTSRPLTRSPLILLPLSLSPTLSLFLPFSPCSPFSSLALPFLPRSLSRLIYHSPPRQLSPTCSFPSLSQPPLTRSLPLPRSLHRLIHLSLPPTLPFSLHPSSSLPFSYSPV